MLTFIVITGQAEGSTADGFRTAYYSDLRQFSAKDAAVSHGFTLGRTDDFNIGQVRAGRLESIWWMDQQLATDQHRLAAIGREIGLTRA